MRPPVIAFDAAALELTIAELRELSAGRFCALSLRRPPETVTWQGLSCDREKLPVLKSQVRRLSAFQKAALAGCLVQEVHDRRAKLGWQDYQRVGRELMR